MYVCLDEAFPFKNNNGFIDVSSRWEGFAVEHPLGAAFPPPRHTKARLRGPWSMEVGCRQSTCSLCTRPPSSWSLAKNMPYYPYGIGLGRAEAWIMVPAHTETCCSVSLLSCRI